MQKNFTISLKAFLFVFVLITGVKSWGQAALPVSRTIWNSVPSGWTDNMGTPYLTSFACSGNNGGKFDASGETTQVNFNGAPDVLNFVVKSNAATTSSLKVEESVDGTVWSQVVNLSATAELPTSCTKKGPYNLSANSRFVRFTFTKGTQNMTIDDIEITAAPALPTKLVIKSVTPATPTTNSPFAIVVEAQNSTGAAANVAADVAVTLTENGAGNFTGTTTGTISAGSSSVTISGVKYDAGENNVTITASGGSLTAGSATINVLPSASQLAFVSFPASVTKNQTLPAFTVEARRPDGTVDNTFSGVITLNKTAGGGTVTGTLLKSAVNGVATFNDIVINGTGDHTFEATSGSLTAGTATVNVLATASQLAFAGFPAAAMQNQNFASFSIEARRADNSVDNTYTGSITLGIASGPGTVSGTLTKAAVNGVAIFNDIKVDQAGTYTLSAGAPGLSSITSSPVVVAAYLQPAGLLLLEDNFDYPPTDNLTNHGWAAHSSAGSNPIKVNSLGLSYSGYGSTEIGKSAILNNSGEDVSRTFSQQNTGSNTYCSFLVNVSAAAAAGDYIVHFGPTNIGTEFRGRVFIRSSAGSLQFGLSNSGSNTSAVFSSTNYLFNTTYLVVLKMYYDASSQTSSLFINPTLNAEPNTATISETTNASLPTNIGSIALRQSASTYNFIIDNVRVATNYGALTGNPQYSSTETINGGYYNTITVNAGADVTVAGQVKLVDELTVAGSLNTGNDLVLKSTAFKTARIATVSGTITGNVTIERFIGAPAAKRAWRLLTTPLRGATNNSVFYNWQSNGAMTPNYGTLITGPTAGNGLDAVSGYSLKYFDGTTLQGVDNTNTTNLFGAGAGTTAGNNSYFLFVRGDRSSSNLSATSQTTLTATGTVQTGDQVFSTNATSDGFTLIGNPYPSQVDFDLLRQQNATANIKPTLYYWDANAAGANGLGAYGIASWNGSGYDFTGAATVSTTIIPSGSAFFVQTLTNQAGTTPSVKFTESQKTAAAAANILRVGSQTEKLDIKLQTQDATPVVLDGALARFNNTYSAEVGNEDAGKLMNTGENIAFTRMGKTLSIEGRPLIDNADTLFLDMSNMKQNTGYAFSITLTNFNAPSLEAYLVDRFLGTIKTISLAGNTTESFTVTADPASTGNRFIIVFRQSATLPVNYTSVKAYQHNAGVQVEWTMATETNIRHYEVEKSTDGRSFEKTGTVAAKLNNNAATYTWFDASPVNGTNYYRIKAVENAGTAKYSQVVTVKIGGKSAIALYPNPVVNNTTSLQLINQPNGSYTLKLVNNLGQVVYRKVVEHAGGSSTQTINFGSVVSKGVYQLQITGADVKMNQTLICK